MHAYAACDLCRTNFDCDNLEKFLLGLGGDGSSSSGAFRGKREGGKEHPYACVVLAGQRTMDERRAALQVGWRGWCG
jgi:ATP-dependent RNA helicase DDX1